MVLAKQKSSSDETKINNTKIKKIIFLYNLVWERFVLLNTQIDSVKHSNAKRKYKINKNIKRE